MLGRIERYGIALRDLRRDGRCRGRMDWSAARRHLARHSHALSVALEFDLTEAGFLEQARQVTDKIVIDRGSLFGRLFRFALAAHGFGSCAAMRVASPSIASA